VAFPPVAGTPAGNFRPLLRVLVSEPAVIDDAQLIEETLAGRSAAFGELVRKYQDRLYNTMVHVVGSRDDAQDVIQEAFVQALVKLDTFHQSSAFYTWLYRIAFNMAVTHRRRRKPTASIEHARETMGEEPVDGESGPREQLELEERREQVRTAIARLSEDHRTVLVLREVDGCCYETIAEILELPVGTVRSRLHRARLQLREELKEVLILDE
jgi:RNA polymerase sigma-70 factor (ECF subfamily)